MREKEGKPNNFTGKPFQHGSCILCGKTTANIDAPFVCCDHALEKADCNDCPAKDCGPCKRNGKTIYRKIKNGG